MVYLFVCLFVGGGGGVVGRMRGLFLDATSIFKLFHLLLFCQFKLNLHNVRRAPVRLARTRHSSYSVTAVAE